MTPEKALWYMRIYGEAMWDEAYYYARQEESERCKEFYHRRAKVGYYLMERFERELKR